MPLQAQLQRYRLCVLAAVAIDQLKAKLDRQITRSNRLRQSAIAAAFSGALV